MLSNFKRKSFNLMGKRFIQYIQGQSPDPRIREYFYYIDHQGQVRK